MICSAVSHPTHTLQIKYMNQIESKVGFEGAVVSKEAWKAGVKSLQAYVMEARSNAMNGISNDASIGGANVLPSDNAVRIPGSFEPVGTSQQQFGMSSSTFQPVNMAQASQFDTMRISSLTQLPGVAMRSRLG